MYRPDRTVTVLFSLLLLALATAGGASGPALAQGISDAASDDAWALDPQLIDRGEAVYRGICRDCHGREGDLEALGQSRRLAGLRAAEVVESLTTLRDTGDFSAMPIRIKSPLSDADIRALAAYIATFGAESLQE